MLQVGTLLAIYSVTMKNLKVVSFVSGLTLILAACGSALNGSYNIMPNGGLTSCGSSTVSLSLTQSGSNVTGSGQTNPACATYSLQGTANGNTITNVQLTITPTGNSTAYNGYNNGYNGYNNGYNGYNNNNYYGYNGLSNQNYGTTGTTGTGCVYIGTLTVSGNGTGSTISGQLTLQANNTGLCTQTVSFNGTKI